MKEKNNLFILVCILIVITIFSSFSFLKSLKSIYNNYYNQVYNKLNIINDKISHGFLETSNITNLLSAYPETIQYLSTDKYDEHQKNLNTILDQISALYDDSIAYVMNTEGTVVASSNRNASDSFLGENYSFRPYFQKALQGDPFLYFSVGVTSKKIGSYQSYPVLSNNKIIGVVVIKITLENIEKELKGITGNDTLFFTNSDNIIYLSTDPNFLLKNISDITKSYHAHRSLKGMFMKFISQLLGIKNNFILLNNNLFYEQKIDLKYSHGLSIYGRHDANFLFVSILKVAISTGIIFSLILIASALSVIHILNNKKLLKLSHKLESLLNFQKSLFESIPIPIFYKDTNGKYLDFNQAFAEMANTPSEEIKGKTIYDLWPTEQSKNYHAKDLALLKDPIKGIQTSEFKITDKNKNSHVIILNKSIYYDHFNKPAGIIGTFIDITEIKKIQNKLEESAAYTNNIMHSMLDCLIIINPDGTIKTVNEASCQLLEYSKEELIGARATLIFSQEEKGDAEGLTTLINQESIHNLELTFKTKSGRLVPVLISGSAMKKDNCPNNSINDNCQNFKTNKKHCASFIAIVCVAKDISQIKATEEESKKLIKIIEESPVSIVITDSDGLIEYANPYFCEHTGYSLEEALGQNPRILNTGFQPKEYYAQMWQTIREGKTWQGEFQNKKKNGECYWEEAVISSITDKKNNITHYLAIKVEITKQKNIENQLEKAYVELETEAAKANLLAEKAMLSAKSKSEFLANMSHEIRTPMNAIIGFSKLLQRSELNNKQKNQLDLILTSGTLLLGIINDILDFSKIEAKKIVFESIDFNLHTLINDVLKMIIIKTGYTPNIHTYIEIQKGIPAVLKGDPTRLKQIFINLLGNAAKFTEKGEIGVIVSLSKDQYRISNPQHIPLTKNEELLYVNFCIKDTGKGIAKDKLETIFEPFTQEDTSTTRQYGGTGLGLTICKSLINAMNGRLWIESELGKGSSFIFTIPFAKRTEPIKNNSNNVSLKYLKDKKIIIIDDNEIDLQILKKYCENAKMNVLTCESSSVAALKQLTEINNDSQIPDIILCDIYMPEMSGFELCSEIQKYPRFKSTRIIAISADQNISEQAKTKKNEFDDYISKPFIPEEIYKILVSLVSSPKPENESIDTSMQQLNNNDIENPSQNSKKILVVEDNESNQILIKDVLESICTCEISFAFNGREAIKLVSSANYDICFMDLQMPVMGGLEATKIIREHISKELPIIAFTAMVFPEDKEKALKAGMNGFITKPIDFNELKLCIEKFID